LAAARTLFHLGRMQRDVTLIDAMDPRRSRRALPLAEIDAFSV
jgi:hypothetical protein